ncbi:IS110 family transposase [Erythrobacter sp. NFXS35]|uniref:IS110 family transposase n=1 Tax=Erythrobacter sp. NFXS35 TaxID=2818436 RepID=UPI0032DF4121
MDQHIDVFVGIDVAKSRNAIAIADSERGGEVRYFGEVDAAYDAMRRVVQRITAKHGRAHFCYEAGPTGYGLYRLISGMGYPCDVVAPSLIPRRPGDRVKTNRRDAVGLAKLLRAGELTPVWVPDEGHEAMRDLVRARSAAVRAQRVHRQQVSAFMLKHGRVYPRKKSWSMRYLRWLQEQRFEHPAHQIALQELVDAVRISKERIDRIEAAIVEFLPSWSLAPVVRALQALRGVDLIVAVTFATEVGDVRRFDSPGQLMGYLGLVPSERSTGDTIRRGGITKAGNSRVRHMLVESAWTYRHPPRVGTKKLYLLEQTTPKVREIAWKAQSRLTGRYRTLSANGKKTTVVCTAVARELAGFMWAVAREVQTA